MKELAKKITVKSGYSPNLKVSNNSDLQVLCFTCCRSWKLVLKLSWSRLLSGEWWDVVIAIAKLGGGGRGRRSPCINTMHGSQVVYGSIDEFIAFGCSLLMKLHRLGFNVLTA